ncbi:hypothetical protein RhiirA5_362496 [Rhizophagus irregularis]|uniref:GST N-terminal domain-containing protein n=1 Tax=Rhizophagus irregularis TaxID=588596 RepID=A0A2I1ECM7_9GLOM|nr:hypothetical protein RhiirA5_362496 [Rhizophagus irregularis]PKY19861.1 hypothetical protein RhiirB3_407431 [Rhizophagus irregularis]CAB4476042.1 unnamed protein product [Rhizophagus irregularis]CAB5133893.1 unnamed protein product [Rhizophagus irregularis]CAB5292104.1 unnamed protein product [Rhizophagus irregularis]
MEPPIILHHFEGSLFSQKIVWTLSIKKLKWTSVIVSPINKQRPLLQLLVHGYRRVPILQIGSDIFIDTKLIMEELERRYPEPSIFPKRNGSDKSDKGLSLAMSTWVDNYIFSSTFILLPIGSKEPSKPKLFSTKEFVEDRSSLIGAPINVEKRASERSYHLDKIRISLDWIELQFSDDRDWFLDTPYPGIADIHVAMNLWFYDILQIAKEVANSKLYPKTYSWLSRFLKYVKSNGIKPEKISGEEALEVAKKFKPFNGGKMKIEQDPNDINKRKLGDNVIIVPDDYGKTPVTGKIVSLSNSRIGIRPHGVDKTGIEVVTWFPRAGYVIKPDNGLIGVGKL